MTTADLDVPGVVPTPDEQAAFEETLFWATNRKIDYVEEVISLETAEHLSAMLTDWLPVLREYRTTGVILASPVTVAGTRAAITTVETIAAESTVEPADYHEVLLTQMRGLLERLERAAAA